MEQVLDIYNYIDYREFLRDFYLQKKSENKKFSQRYFAHKLGINSSGFFSDIIKGKRNLSTQILLKLNKILGFNTEQSNYFENMVCFNQAKTLGEKNHWLKKLMMLKKVNTTLLNKNEYLYFSKWYHSAIRELLYFKIFYGDYKHLAECLNPSIKEEEAKQSVELLEELGFIKKDELGRYRQNEMVLTTGDTVRSIEVANYQIQTMKLAMAALEKVSSEERDITTLTMSLSEQGFDKVQKIIKKARDDILKAAKKDSDETRVVQVNIQSFPLSK